MSADLNVGAPYTEPEPMPELAEKPEPRAESAEHLDADDDRNATDTASSDTAFSDTASAREPAPEAYADNVAASDTDLPVKDPEGAGAAAKDTAHEFPNLFTDLRSEARSRSLRTLAQGGVVAVLAQTVLVLYPLAQHLQTDTSFRVDWKAEGLIVAAAAGNALLAYIQKAMGR